MDRINANRSENGLGAIGGAASPTMRVDSRGNKYALLSKGDRATDIYRPPCENAAGHFIVGRIFGASRSTPEAVRMAMSTGDNSAGGVSN